MLNPSLNAILQILEQLEPIFHAAYSKVTVANFERLVSLD
jgi:hypothetical protein